jgi:exo-beta-1,3-glucanase (GH17 family)
MNIGTHPATQLEAIKQTKVNLSVYLGNYNVPTDAGAAYVRQRDTIKEALQTYGVDNVAGVTVGNEFMLKYVQHYLLCLLLLNTIQLS